MIRTVIAGLLAAAALTVRIEYHPDGSFTQTITGRERLYNHPAKAWWRSRSADSSSMSPPTAR
jgi:hypothetical protein